MSRTSLITFFILLGMVCGGFSESGLAQQTNTLRRAQQLEANREYSRAQMAYREYASSHPTSQQAVEGWLRTAIRARNWSS
ncbi:MAG: hypothetical protein ABEK50_04550, partial [bacterium]